MHSTISDGTNTPEELLALVRDAGIPLFAVTDHDAIKAYGIIREIRTAEDPYLISGVEFSCRDELGHYHILGYGYDPDSTPVQNVVKHGHQLRMKKVKKEGSRSFRTNLVLLSRRRRSSICLLWTIPESLISET